MPESHLSIKRNFFKNTPVTTKSSSKRKVNRKGVNNPKNVTRAPRVKQIKTCHTWLPTGRIFLRFGLEWVPVDTCNSTLAKDKSNIDLSQTSIHKPTGSHSYKGASLSAKSGNTTTLTSNVWRNKNVDYPVAQVSTPVP